MGAIEIVDIIWGYGRRDMKNAYREIVADSIAEYGYDPYSGTIATTSGVRLSPLSKENPIPEDEVTREMIDKCLGWSRKGGHCRRDLRPGGQPL